MNSLMIIVPDKISDFVSKGEIIERYYNPGNLFGEVHLVMTNDDAPDRVALQKMVGDARLFLHNLPDSRKEFVRTLGWRPWLLGPWVGKAVELAQSVRPALIRCHGALLNAFAAATIKQKLGIPYVVSMHINPDEDVRGRANGWVKRFVTWAQQDIERIGLLNADLVMPVYRPIVPYLQRVGVSRYEVCYNSLNPTHLLRKDDYRLHDPVRVISVGRQFAEKNPDNLIKAVAALPNVRLTLVGDGTHHAHIKKVAEECHILDRVEFFASMPNDELCRKLPEFDIFATHSEYWEISKSVLEPLLTGLPVVINRRKGAPVPELTDDICFLVANTVESYREALERLTADGDYRERLGRAAYAHAQSNWSPAATEAKFVAIYRRLVGAGGSESIGVKAC
jgi:glycosyltransferase involved in cell wall biosynthesis